MRTATSSADLLGANNEIARKLEEYYRNLVSEEVPDRFTELLARLEQVEPGAQRPDTSADEPANELEASTTKAES